MNILAHYQAPNARRRAAQVKLLKERMWAKYGEHGIKWTVEDWEKTIEAFGGSCAYCGLAEPDCHKRTLAIDHYVPAIMSGRTEPGNCVPACKSCNSSKGGKMPREIYGPMTCARIESILDELRGTGEKTADYIKRIARRTDFQPTGRKPKNSGHQPKKEIEIMGYSMNDMFPSKYLKAEDFAHGEDKIVTIKETAPETFGEGAKAETKFVLWTREAKPIVLNKTNASIIAHLYGPNTDDWFGKQIALYVTEVASFGEVTNAIRIRNFVPGQGGQGMPAQSSQNGYGQAPARSPHDAQMRADQKDELVRLAKGLWGDRVTAEWANRYPPMAQLTEASADSALRELRELSKPAASPMVPAGGIDDFDDSDPFADN